MYRVCPCRRRRRRRRLPLTEVVGGGGMQDFAFGPQLKRKKTLGNLDYDRAPRRTHLFRRTTSSRSNVDRLLFPEFVVYIVYVQYTIDYTVVDYVSTKKYFFLEIFFMHSFVL